jgi:hypothetical protein
MHDKKHHIGALGAEERSELARRGLQAWANNPVAPEASEVQKRASVPVDNLPGLNLDGMAVRADVVTLDDPRDPDGVLHYVAISGLQGTQWVKLAMYRVRWTAGHWMLRQLDRWPKSPTMGR